MKAAVLKRHGAPLAIETVPDPVLGTGEVIVDVASVPVLAYAAEVFAGRRNYPVELPMIPGSGAVGRVRALGPDATRLAVGDWVFCDPTVRSRDNAQAPDITLQGLIAPTEGAMRLHRHFHDGGFAEQIRVPTENAVPLGARNAEEAQAFGSIGRFLVPYGGLLAGGLMAGETVLISGATGSFGSAGISVALAMGAGCVIATGRNEQMLAELSARFGARLRTVAMRGDEEGDRAGILEAAPGPIDIVLDLLPPAATTAQVRAAVMAVRSNGRIVLMGGIGAGLALPYAWMMRNNITLRGQWMYPPDAIPRMVSLIRAGLIDTSRDRVTSFTLDEANEAVAYAAENSGPFRLTVIRP